VADGVRKDEEFSGTKPVEERHRIDEMRLDGWMRGHVEGYAGPLTVLQFKGGQSNPTYRLDTSGRSYVMRRKPFGKLLPSAHAVDREFKVIAALSKQGFPVARAYALCTDDSVIGAAFYIMSMEEGRVFWDPSLPSQTRGEKSSPARSRRWQSCTDTIRKKSVSAISASPAIISRARSTAGPSSTALPKPSTFPKSKS
jgi:aminoglycoside phosphotransferase (APT) family kinase protein